MAGTSSATTVASARDIAPVGPLARTDRAFFVLRRAGVSAFARACGAGLPPATVILALYYLEEVEGARGVRPVFAVLLALAWLWRSLLLSRVARLYAALLWPPLHEEPPTRAVDVVRTASAVGLGLWVWCWLLVAAAWLGPLALALVFPLFALRGAGGPSWLARASCAPEAGWSAMRKAYADAERTRPGNVLTELLLILGAFVLLANAWAAIGVLSLVGRSFLGFELALVDAFLSPRNDLTVLAVTAAVMILLEPLRAALSAVAFVDGRVRREALDLRAAVDDALAPAGAARGAKSAPSALAKRAAHTAIAVLASMALIGGAAQAQESRAPEASEGATEMSELGLDREAGQEAAAILGGPEFREYGHTERESLGDILERLLHWLFDAAPSAPDAELPLLPRLALPSMEVFLAIAIALAGLVALFLLITHLRRGGPQSGAASEAPALAPSTDPRERAPNDWLGDARALSARGEHRLALRALYLAALVSLDRRRLIEFDPARTNWQYLRKMPDGEPRRALRELTQIFDHKWYGHEPTSAEDFEACLARAARLVDEGQG